MSNRYRKGFKANNADGIFIIGAYIVLDGKLDVVIVEVLIFLKSSEAWRCLKTNWKSTTPTYSTPPKTFGSIKVESNSTGSSFPSDY